MEVFKAVTKELVFPALMSGWMLVTVCGLYLCAGSSLVEVDLWDAGDCVWPVPLCRFITGGGGLVGCW